MVTLEQYRDFPFPLNVYAHVLALEEGGVTYLHYGLFESPEDGALQAQYHSSRLLFDRLPSPPCRVLEVGIGLATTLAELLQRGYEVTGITPDAAQIASAKERFGQNFPVVCTGLEDFSGVPGSFDLILFQESAQYIAPLDLLSKASDSLAMGGALLIVDEFALSRTQPGKENLHLLEHFLAQAERFGFTLAEHLDLSSLAAPTLDYLLAGVEKHRSRLQEDLGLTPAQLDGLNASNLAYQEKYASGRFGYALLRLVKSTAPAWRIGAVGEGEQAQMQALFREVFGHDMTPAHWCWKYAQGRGQAIGVWKDGGLVAHYGGATREILFFGQPERALQLCDVMVKNEGRRTLSRKGPFFLAAATFLENHLGYGTKHIVAIGFPNPRAKGLPEKLGLYGDEVERMVEVSWEPLAARPRLWTETRELNSQDPLSAEAVDSLWESMRQEFRDGLIGIRDWQYLQYRYFSHPDKQYRAFLIRNRLGKKPRALFICRRHDQDCEMLEMIAPSCEFPLLVEQARRIAVDLGAARLYCWVTAHHSALFSATRGAVRDLDVPVPANLWTSGPSLEQIRNRWWLTSGDTDFH